MFAHKKGAASSLMYGMVKSYVAINQNLSLKSKPKQGKQVK